MSTNVATSSPYVTELSRVIDHAHCGGKALRLAEMQRLGYPIPDAVVITGAAFCRMLAENALGDPIDAIVRSLSVDDLMAIAHAAEEIDTLVTQAELPSDVAEDLTAAAVPLLESGLVVVRSSACGEDSGDAAFAGQLDSFLGVNDVEALLDAVKRCWSSYWSHRSLTYQLTRDCSLAGMGVVIQRQVDAQVAGVLFTRDINKPESGEMVAEYCRGLADGLVSGRVRPTRVTIASDRWSMVESDDPAPSVDDAMIAKLADVGRSLEDDYGVPQDVEWAIDHSGQLHVVQSRPITAFAAQHATTVWSNANVNENFPEPVSPLLYSIASVGYYHYFRNLGLAFGVSPHRIKAMEYPLRNVIGTHGGRIYYNLTNIHAVLRAAPCGEFLSQAFNQFVGAGATAARGDLPDWRSLRKGRLAEFRELGRIAVKGFRRLRRMERGVAAFEKTIDAFADDSEPKRLRTLSWEELHDLWRRFMEIRCEWTDASIADAATMLSYGLSQKLFAGEFTDEADRAIANRFLTGLCNIVSGLPTERLWDLSRLVRRNSEFAKLLLEQPANEVWQQLESDDSFSDIRDALLEFLDEWGFRCSGELMLTTPSYQENPAALLDLLRAYVERDGESPRELLIRQQQNRERETERVMSVLSRRELSRLLPWPRKNFVAKRLIRWTQRSVACRERARLKQALLYSRCRRLALAIGEAFVANEILNRDEDVFFLTFEEIESLLSGCAMFPKEAAKLSALRRSAHEKMGTVTPPDRIELAPGQYWIGDADELDVADPTSSDEVFRGVGVCGGRIVGRAVVLTSPEQFDQVAPGDILVTRQTDPGWGPILFLVRGLVMERGGMLSHGAILAREYGIPTVVDVRDATRRLASGGKLRVDGDHGVVEILDE